MTGGERRRQLAGQVSERFVTDERQRQLYQTDPTLHYQVKMIREAVQSMDDALAAEGIPEPVRDRVCFRVLYGEAPDGITPPDFREARNRMDDRAAMLSKLASKPLGPEWSPDGR